MSEATITVQETQEQVKRRKNREKMKRWRDANPDAQKRIARKSYEKHKEKINSYDRQRWEKRREAYNKERNKKRQENKEEVRKKDAINYANNRDRKKAIQRKYSKTKNSREKSKQWRQKNKARLLVIQRNWQRRNPGKMRHYAAKRRALELGCNSPATPKQIVKLLSVFDECFYCDREFSKTDPLLKKTLDHVYPLTKKGPHEVWNLVAACRSCNSRKNNKIPGDFVEELLSPNRQQNVIVAFVDMP